MRVGKHPFQAQIIHPITNLATTLRPMEWVVRPANQICRHSGAGLEYLQLVWVTIPIIQMAIHNLCNSHHLLDFHLEDLVIVGSSRIWRKWDVIGRLLQVEFLLLLRQE